MMIPYISQSADDESHGFISQRHICSIRLDSFISYHPLLSPLSIPNSILKQKRISASHMNPPHDKNWACTGTELRPHGPNCICVCRYSNKGVIPEPKARTAQPHVRSERSDRRVIVPSVVRLPPKRFIEIKNLSIILIVDDIGIIILKDHESDHYEKNDTGITTLVSWGFLPTTLRGRNKVIC
jgi:hypothetical protein